MSEAHQTFQHTFDPKARTMTIKWVIRHLLHNPVNSIALICSLILANVFQSLLPVIIGVFIDQVILPRKSADMAFYLGLILIIGLLRVVMETITSYSANALSWRAMRKIRVEFFDSLQSKPLRFHDQTRSGNVMAIATNDMDVFSNMINPGIQMVSNAILSFIIFAIVGLLADYILAMLVFPLLIIYFWSVRRYSNKLKPIAAVFQQKWSYMSIAAQDNITGVRVVRAFGGEDFEINKFRIVVTDFKKIWLAQQWVQARFWPLLVIYTTIGFAFFAGIWLILTPQIVIGTLVINQHLTVGTLLAFNGMLIILVQPTFIIAFAIEMMQGGLAGGERIFKMMYTDTKEEDENIIRKTWPSSTQGSIEFKNVNFKYEGTDKYVLKNINFTVEPGETVAVVGPTGSGKTTLTQLLLRFYDYEGIITIDGTDITEYSLRDIRHNVSRVEQDIFLFATSIRNNITFGVSQETIIPQEEIERVAKMAQAHEFIMEQPQGYDTIIGERGVGLSGGQKQRIAIARCLLTDPRILILDDSTSAIDSQTEEQISKAMDQVMKGRTTFLITHRLSAIRDADKIIVLKDGTIKAIGTHEELIAISPDYQRIFNKQYKMPLLDMDQIQDTGAFVFGGDD